MLRLNRGDKSKYIALPRFSTRRDAVAGNKKFPGGFLRWKANEDALGRIWEMQTAIATFENNNRTIDLHAMIHYGEDEYFKYYNHLQGEVLYELLVEESQLMEDRGLRRLKPGSTIQATLKDRSLANQYGWTCQADSIRYNEDWIHADLSTQEFLKQVGKRKVSSHEPLWQLASNERFPSPAWEAATALVVGPPILPFKKTKRRLFSNLFVSGATVANLLRAFLWLTIPSPELSILLLDWSSLSSMSISQIALPLGEAVAQGHLAVARQLIFGQVALLASKASQFDSSPDELLIMQRNHQAMSVLDRIEPSSQFISLLYGCNHCPDLTERLTARGYNLAAINWRTAWTVRLNKRATASTADKSEDVELAGVFLFALPLYLAVGAFDWIATWQAASIVTSAWELFFVLGLYLVRHAVMYSALSKYVLDIEDKITNR